MVHDRRGLRGKTAEMTFSIKRPLLLAIAAYALAGCANYSEVSGKRPLFLPKPAGRGILVKAEAEIEKALREDRSKPVGALDEYLVAAQTAEQQLHSNPDDAAA